VAIAAIEANLTNMMFVTEGHGLLHRFILAVGLGGDGTPHGDRCDGKDDRNDQCQLRVEARARVEYLSHLPSAKSAINQTLSTAPWAAREVDYRTRATTWNY
jgi:hypothetical protein